MNPRTCLAALFLAFVLPTASAWCQSAVPTPTDRPAQALPEFHSRHGVLKVTLTAAAEKVDLGGAVIDAMVFNGNYGGPVLHVRPGETMKLHLVNHLDQAINLHFHGYQGSPLGRSDNMHIVVDPGKTFDYLLRIPKTQPPGLYWYHTHIHGRTELHVMSGLSGMLVIDGLERRLHGLRGVRQSLFALREYRFDDDNTDPLVDQYFHHTAETINGGLTVAMSMRPGETGLWSFVNQGPDLAAHLKLEGHRFRIVAIDGDALTREVDTDELVITPAGRVEALVEAGAPGTYKFSIDRMTNSGAALSSQRTIGMLTVSGGGLKGAPRQVRFAKSETLIGKPISMRRTFVLTEDAINNHYYINGKLFDHQRVDTRVPLGSIEEWTVRNDSDDYHSFHIHQIGYQVVEINGKPQPFQGFQDTVEVPPRGEVKLIMPFTDPLIVGRFMYHCHVLEHEDKGMMATIEVFDPKAPAAKQMQSMDPHMAMGEP